MPVPLKPKIPKTCITSPSKAYMVLRAWKMRATE